MPECFFELRFPILFEVDAFKGACNHDDIWPCAEPTAPAHYANPPFPLAPTVNPTPFALSPGFVPKAPDWTHVPTARAPDRDKR
jgi:hypothetical protein